jgi:nucleotide-binding universal stress UspA family protein
VYRQILVAFDGSPDSQQALQEACRLAGIDGRLTIVGVAPHPTSWIVGGTMAPPYDSTELQAEIDKSWQAQLGEAADSTPEELRGRVETKLLHGAAGPAIVDEISGGDHDLVVLGTRGHSAAGALLLGSVSLHVVHRSTVPALIVRAGEPD